VPAKKGGPLIIETKLFTSQGEVDQAILKLKRRLDEVRALDPRTVGHDDPRISSAAANFRNTVLEIYGPNSPEYQRAQYQRIWHGPIRVNASQHELQAGFAAGVVHTIEADRRISSGPWRRRRPTSASIPLVGRGQRSRVSISTRASRTRRPIFIAISTIGMPLVTRRSRW
jgi:hypothetical protein